MIEKHHISSKDNEQYTPGNITHKAQAVMQGIDLDPASSEIANRIVGARKFYTEEQDGLRQDWEGNVWLNPPGGIGPKEFNSITKSRAALWWHFLTLHYCGGAVSQALFLGFNFEQLQNIQKISGGWTHPLDYPTVFFKYRIQFMSFDEKGKLVNGKQPTHGNYLTFLPPKNNSLEAIQRFKDNFGSEGKLINV